MRKQAQGQEEGGEEAAPHRGFVHELLVNGSITARNRRVQWGCWCGEKEKDFCCNHVEYEQAAEGNVGQQLRCGTWCRRELAKESSPQS